MKRVFVLLLAVYFASCRVLFPRVPDVISRDSLIPDECEWKNNKTKRRCVNNDVFAVRKKAKVCGHIELCVESRLSFLSQSNSKIYKI